jgi:MinD-like ATPase involved in chromosome partitioning or flagellar assembly
MTSEDQQAVGPGEELPPVPAAQVGPPRPPMPAGARPGDRFRPARPPGGAPPSEPTPPGETQPSGESQPPGETRPSGGPPTGETQPPGEPAQPAEAGQPGEAAQPAPAPPAQPAQPARPPHPPASAEHGARPVPVANSAAPFTVVSPGQPGDRLQPAEAHEPIRPIPDDQRAVLQIARGPLRRGAIVPVVGWEGGAGRTTVTRALAAAFRRVRGEDPVVIDAVPMWGALTAAADQPGEYSAADLATMAWPIPPAVMPRLLTTVDGLPTLVGPAPGRGVLSEPRTLLTAVDRMAKLARLTFIDTVADIAGSPNRDLIRNPSAAVVWVASPTRAGLWGVAEALTYYRAIGAEHVARRSVVAIVGGKRHWPADAAAAEAQLTGLGVETVRVPHSAKPLTDSRCRPSFERMLAAVVLRSG